MIEKRSGVGKTIPYELDGNILSFNDDELMLNLKKYEMDFERQLDICSDEFGCLCMGLARNYVAQVIIPARRYNEIEVGRDEETDTPIMEKQEVPFDPELVTIVLWDMEE